MYTPPSSSSSTSPPPPRAPRTRSRKPNMWPVTASVAR
jgi:hypothetical protein